MSPERWKKIEEIYHSAEGRKPEERGGFVAEACAGDVELKRQIEAMLAQDSPRDILDGPAEALVPESSASPISRLGPYEIVSRIGKGGMGTVWKARDSRLNRDVAIKISARQFTDRFEREAHAIAALNHPHICTLYDIGPNYLVMELVEGETLDERMKRGPVPLEEAVGIAKQIAEALEAAHEKGIVHRDLKPANIKIRPDGSVKVLDFGLAKAGVEYGAHTSSGMIMGTPGYMAPEQMRGEPVDKRADIWTFGVVVYEMVSGRRLKDEPEWNRVPARLERVLRLCLEKDPNRRLRHTSSVPILLEQPVPTKRRSLAGWAAAGLLAVAAVILAVAAFRDRTELADPVQFTIAAEGSAWLEAFAISPDGRHLAFVASDARGVSALWVRPLAAPEAHVLPGTEGARPQPFWSPDSRYLGFFADGKLRKLDVRGGTPITLCDAVSPVRATWNRGDTIVFGSTTGPLYKVAAAGGIATPVTTLGEGEFSHSWPSFLPDGRHILYQSVRSTPYSRELRVASLDSAVTTSLGAADSRAVYASGDLVFVRGGTLTAQPFDPVERRTKGDPFPLAGQVGGFSVSATGVLFYWPTGGGRMSRLTWTDRAGKTLGTVGGAGTYWNLNLSPDETRVAVSMTTGAPPNMDIWLIDLARAATASRLTFDPASEGDPVWSPDGSQVLFNSDRNGLWNSAFRRGADGGGPDVPVVKVERVIEAPDWSHDGRFLVFDGGGTPSSLWMLPFSGDQKPALFLRTEFTEDSPAFSPDDRWVAYDSNASGRFEVYVRSFSPGGNRPQERYRQFQISRDGGWAPKWRGDGREIFFLAPDGTMMAANVTLGDSVQAAVPHPLFPTALLKDSNMHPYAVTRDGRRFLIIVPDPQSTPPLTVVVNWPALVKK